MWPDSEETQKLLREAGEGDAQAINQLMDRHRNSLRQMVRMRLDRALAQRVDASDVVQDVLLEASRRLDDYIRSGSNMPFHLWLRQLAKDRVIDMHRRHREAGQTQRPIENSSSPAPPTPIARHSTSRPQLRDHELTPGRREHP